MTEDRNIEQSQEDGKTESREKGKPGSLPQPIVGQKEEVNDESQIINRETLPALTADQAGDISTSEIPKSEIPKSEIMEIHTPHNVMHKKNWKEYLLEFFMIFFAVTLGFFAEGYREYISDRHKEKEYMQGLLKDMCNDSVALKTTKNMVAEQDNGLDSLVWALRQPLSVKENLERVYVLYLKYGDVYDHVSFSEGSIAQMINSGGLRIIRHSDIVKLINEYQSIKLLVRKDEDDMRRFEGEIERGQANHIFDFTTFSKFDKFIDTTVEDISVDSLAKLADEDKIYLINEDPVFIASFRNNLKSYKAFNVDYLYYIQGTIDINNKIIQKIKEEYGEKK
jgi:hypothetical protein